MTSAINPRILCISGSLRPQSSNGKIIRFVIELFNDVADFTVYNGLATLPYFSPEIDIQPGPETVAAFRQQLQAADGVFICTPEYAFGVPGVLKNALDWTVSSAEFSGKPVALITASSVGEKGHQALLHTLDALGTHIPEGATLLISFIRSRFDSEGRIKDPLVADSIQQVIKSLLRAVQPFTKEF